MKIWKKQGLLTEATVDEGVSQLCIMHDNGQPILAATIHGPSIVVHTADEGEDFEAVLETLGIPVGRPVEVKKV